MNILLLKVLHLAGAFTLFSSLGSIFLGSSNRKAANILHGVSLAFILIIGFAMLGKAPSGQSWWIAKIALWLFIGAAPALSMRKILPAWLALTLCLLAGVFAAYLGLYKPF